MRIFSYLIFTIFDIKQIRSTKKGYNIIILTNQSTIPPGRIKLTSKELVLIGFLKVEGVVFGTEFGEYDRHV
jgi:hypothetical protein